jgi:predicted O-methyltransferase YrrM
MDASADRIAPIRRTRESLPDLARERERADGDFERVAIPDADADVLRDVLVAEGARVVVEVGLAYGASALAIAEALARDDARGARHVIVDAFQHHFHDVGWDALVAAGASDFCTFLRERSQVALPRLVADGFVADAAFVDGSHVFHNVFVDLFFVRELVRPGGVIVLDDCEWPSVRTAVRYFEVNTGWRAEPIAAPSRLRAYRLPATRIEPSFEDFEPFGLDADP